MALGGVAELFFGVRAEQQSLENIAKPLTVEEAEALLPLPLAQAAPPIPEAYHEQHEAVRFREQAEDERAGAAEHRATLQELRARSDGARPETTDEVDREKLLAEIGELRGQALEERASAHDERAKALQARSAPERRAALERAAAAEHRAEALEEEARALEAQGRPEAELHAALAEAHREQAREQEQRALAEEARGEAERLLGAAADLARARAEMHERWAEVHAARARLAEAHGSHDAQAASAHERVVLDSELLAAAAEQRVDAAEHRARAEALRIADAVVSQTEREQRILQRRARSADDERRRLRRLRPGPGDSFFSPGMVGTASTSSRLFARARQDLDREIEIIIRALEERGPLDRDELKRLVGARYWGPGRFRAALKAAVQEGRVLRHSRTIYGPAGGVHPAAAAQHGAAGGDGPAAPGQGDRQEAPRQPDRAA
jgi:hypothetical protein